MTVLSVFAFAGGSLWLIPGRDWLALLVYLPVLALIALFFYKRVLKPVDPAFPGPLYALAFVTKLLGSLARYWMLVDLYDGRGDAIVYHDEGTFLARYYFRDFDYSIIQYYQVRGEGTTNMAIITGLIYSILPPSLPASFLFFAILAFGGAVLFYGAFRIAFPEARPAMYRFIVFFLPSVLFWPSSLGKDSWIFFSSGIAAYGLAIFISQGRFPGLIWTAIGLLLIFPIRKHFTAFMAIAFGLAYMIGLQRLLSRQHPVVTIAAAGLLMGSLMYIGPAIQNSFGLEEISLEDIESSMQQVQNRTTTGNSRYETMSIFSPAGFVMGIMTVLFRPFPWEAENPMVLVTALEAIVWVALVWMRRGVFWGRLRAIPKRPLIAFLFLYSLLTILAFTSLGNFGILARQRVFFLPFFWMLFA
jgi:hypothetical protein